MARVAWVTGGGTGIGRAVAEALYREGWHVAISGRREDVLKQTALAIGNVLPLPGDAGDAAAVRQSVSAIRERWGPVDLLVNNAGVNTYHTFQETEPEEYEQNFRDNCLSAIRCTRAVLPEMLARRNGAVVNISSILGKWASASSSSYSVSKFAMTGFTESLRQELSGTGVHVMGVYPGFIRTAMTEPFVTPGSPRARMGKPPEAMAAAILKGLRRGKRDVLYPWYVPVVVNLYTWMPGLIDRLRKKFGR